MKTIAIRLPSTMLHHPFDGFIRRLIFVSFAIALWTPVLAQQTSIPQTLHYQGRVLQDGVPFTGTGHFVFAMFDGNDSVIWNNWQGRVATVTIDPGGSGLDTPKKIAAAAVPLPVQVRDGLFSLNLGSGTIGSNNTPIDTGVFFDSSLVPQQPRSGMKLRVWFSPDGGGFTRLSPDVECTSVPYAMVSGIADTVADGSITTAMIDPQTLAAVSIPRLSLISPNGADTTLMDMGYTRADAGLVVAGSVRYLYEKTFSLILGGPFTMGNSVAADTDITNAAPITTNVSAFYMDVNEVTLSQWQSVYNWAKDNGYTDLPAGSGKGLNHPVHTVSWYACVKWCNARSEQAGKTPVYYTNDAQTMIYKTGNVNVTNSMVKWTAKGYRLPTEAEWEKAARGGMTGQRFPWGNTITQNLANYNSYTDNYAYDLGPNGYNAIGSIGGTFPATSPVGSFAANGYGLNDMSGNVWEWCWDWYGTPYAGGNDPRGVSSSSFRVLRGGDWSNYADVVRCADRDKGIPDIAGYDIGFRAVLPLGQ